MQSDQTYLTLSPGCSLRLLERPYIFDSARDELYELDREALEFIRSMPLPTDAPKILRSDGEFMEFCLDERILLQQSEFLPIKNPIQSPLPSLRYLLLHITTRCNLRCAHCFHGDAEPLDMSVEFIGRVMKEFDEMQGLRLLISGGEPFLHPRFDEINEMLDDYSFRTIILSNGTLIENIAIAQEIRAHEVQVSIDGIGPSHDALRGEGSYRKSLRGIELLTQAGLDVSIATMVHARNFLEFDEIEALVKSIGAKEWSIDVPAPAGRWGSPSPQEAGQKTAAQAAMALSCEAMKEIGPVLARSFGGGIHFDDPEDAFEDAEGKHGGHACGAHLCAVMADGSICKCGFYAGDPAGSVKEGLGRVWKSMPRIEIGRLRCDCGIVSQCRGGCRYRAEAAGDALGKDPVMCAANGLPL
jgi:radical SAM protein with 4Fe4S-binding SPASM domain